MLQNFIFELIPAHVNLFHTCRLLKRLILSYKLVLSERSRWLLIVFSKFSNHTWINLIKKQWFFNVDVTVKKYRKYRKRELALLVESFDRLTSEFKLPSCEIQFLRFKRGLDPLIAVRVFLATYRPTTDAGKSNLFCFSFLPLPRPPYATPPKTDRSFRPRSKSFVFPPRQPAWLRVG